MKIRYFIGLFLVTLVLSLVITKVYSGKDKQEELSERPYAKFYDKGGLVVDTSNISMINDGKPYLNVYNHNNHLINSYSPEKMNDLKFDTDVYKVEAKETEEPFANFYDENGKLVNATKDMEVPVTQLSNSGEYELFIFRKVYFKDNIWIGENRIFEQPHRLILEPNEQFEQLSINLFNSKGQQVIKMELGNFISGINIPLEEYLREKDSYTIQFINKNEEQPISILGGVVLFN